MPTAARPANTRTKDRSTATAKRKGLRVERRFTTSDPFDGITFTTRQSRISNPDGTAVFEMPDVEVPDTWDQVAVDILASKYFRKAGVPQHDADGNPVLDLDGNPVLGPERSLKQVAMRLANAWMIWGKKGGYFAGDDDALAYRDEMAHMLAAQIAAPNTPAWFNVGQFEAYGIVADPEGNWYWDPVAKKVVQSTHRYERAAVNACFISSVGDKLVGEGSIFEFIENEARLFKAGSGSGANFSNIRAKGEQLSAGGTSSGVMSFLRVADRAAGSIKSGGSTRRAAKMVILDADHPEIEDFVWCKVREEEKVAALVAAGYSSSFEGDAYDTVAFQNGNNSVRVPETFMDAVAEDLDWNLTARTSGRAMKTLKARQLWHDIAEAAWRCADPGIQFDGTLNAWNTAADTERLRGTNPCSEYTHVDDTACNLASLNLVKFFDSDTQQFDIAAYEHALRLWTLTLEIHVSMSHYPSAEIARKSFQHRTLGLGYCNIGALLMRAGLAYDSDEARAAMGALTGMMLAVAYRTSAEMAAVLGPCDAFGPNRDSMLRVLRNHRRAAYGSLRHRYRVDGYEGLNVEPQELDHLVLAHTPFAALSDPVIETFDDMYAQAEQHGLRNAQTVVIAPTGTIGLVMSADTTGVEPDFALVKMKKLAGGGYMQIVNQSAIPALRSLGYDSAAVAAIEEWMLGTHTLKGTTPVRTMTLAEAGFTAEEIAAAEAALPSMTDLTWAFGEWTIGAAAYERFGVDPSRGGAALLAAAGFSATDVQQSSKTICGHLTVEGCPVLKPEHLPVFDCAVECGDGTRVIHWSGHVKALAAVQPFVSGAISKTINMPNSVSVDEVLAAHELAYKLGVKCVAVYRDGSKLSQPLNSAKSEAEESQTGAAIIAVRELTPGMSPSEYYAGHRPLRFRLPELRYGPRWRVEVGGEELYVGAGEYPDGTLGEVFIDWGKQGSTLRGITSALSITISQALQHGVPLERIVKALKGHTYEPRGMVVGHGNLKMASSIVDAVVRILGHYYLGDDDLVQVKGGPVRAAAPAAAAASPTPAVSTVDASKEGPGVDTSHTDQMVTELPNSPKERLYGVSCSACGGGNLIQAGSCKVCGDCGQTTGCS